MEKQISIRIPEALLKKAKKLCKNEHRSFNGFINYLIEERIKQIPLKKALK